MGGGPRLKKGEVVEVRSHAVVSGPERGRAMAIRGGEWSRFSVSGELCLRKPRYFCFLS